MLLQDIIHFIYRIKMFWKSVPSQTETCNILELPPYLQATGHYVTLTKACVIYPL
jgi:hypothetical protein